MNTYENIFAIFTQDKNSAIVKTQLSSEFFKSVATDKDLILIVEAGQKKQNVSNEGENIKSVQLDCVEAYNNLARKTFELNNFCVQNYIFKRLHKIDDNKLVKKEYVNLSEEIDYFGSKNCSRRSRLLSRKEGQLKNISHVTTGLSRVSRKVFSKWAHSRSLQVKPEYFDDSVFYSTWKPYSVSYKFAKIITKCEDYVNIYSKYLAGCEDHMIGKIHKDLLVYKKLTSN